VPPARQGHGEPPQQFQIQNLFDPKKAAGGDLKSMMNSKKTKRTKDDTMNNNSYHRNQVPPLP
jgi:hypothetical protein